VHPVNPSSSRDVIDAGGIFQSEKYQQPPPRLPDSQKRSARDLLLIAGAAATATVTLLFFMVFCNHFLGLRSGDGGFGGGVFFLNGLMPYRDFYCPTPPLFLFRCAAVLALFGKFPIVIRCFGVLERVVLALLLYGWLARFFKVRDAALAAMVTIVVSAGDEADPISSYNHFTILLAVASGLAASYALDEGRTTRFLVKIGFICGVLSQLCLDSKQTIGLGVSFVVPVVVGATLWKRDGLRKVVRFFAGFTSGWILTACALIGWMAHDGILRTFLRQTFIEGPAAKASHGGDFFWHTIVILEHFWWAVILAGIFLLFSLGPLWKSQNQNKSLEPESVRGFLLPLFLGVGAILYSWILTFLQTPLAQLPDKPLIYLSLFGSALFVFYDSWSYLQGTFSTRQSQFTLFVSIAFTVAFMTSLSFPAFEAMIVPGLGLILAALLDVWQGWRRVLLYAVCAGLLVCQVEFKKLVPFGFVKWYEPPVAVATVTSSLPELKGFRLPANTVDFLDSTVQIIRENSTPDDTIFTYPELGIFYGITGRRPATFSASHNIDVAPDRFAKQEAERLLRVRPAVLIYGPLPPGLLESDERFWRNGQPSGQRDLIQAVETLAREYKLVRVFKLYPSDHPVYVFVRPGR
jgi:hypothetical protein